MERTHPTAPPPTMRTGISVTFGILFSLKEQFQRQLQLPRIEHRPWRSEQGIRHRRSGRRTPAHLSCLDGLARCVLVLPGYLSSAEVVRSIHADNLINIWAIQHIESIDGSFEPHPLAGKLERPLQTNIPGLEAIPLVGIS